MLCNARLILGFRAAGLLLLGLNLHEVVTKAAVVLLDQRILDLRRGHPEAILGMLDTLLTVAADVLHWSAILPFAAALAGIAMVVLPRDRIARVIRRLEPS